MIRKYLIFLYLIFISSFSYSQSKNDSYLRELEIEIEEKDLKIDSLDFYLQSYKLLALKQSEKRKIWIKVSISELIVVSGVGVALVTGVWVPVLMGVALFEFFIISEGNYRLNLKQIRKEKAIYQRNRKDGKIGHK